LNSGVLLGLDVVEAALQPAVEVTDRMLQLDGEAAKHVIECELGVRIHGTMVMLKAGAVVVGKRSRI